MKEGIDRLTKFVENWTEESSITGPTDANGNTRREDCGDIKECAHSPRAIGKRAKRAQTFSQRKWK